MRRTSSSRGRRQISTRSWSTPSWRRSGLVRWMSGRPLPELTGSDRRRFPRFAAPPAASVRLRPDVVARLLDLGVGGALVESPLRLIPGSVTPVVLSGFGLDFQAKALIHRSSISGFVRSLQGERAPLY